MSWAQLWPAGIPRGASPQVVRAGIVLGLTVIWWACAVGVTLLLKAVLGGNSGLEHAPWRFPFPLTLTLLSNLATAALTGLLALARWPGNGTELTEQAMLRASSREALLRELPRQVVEDAGAPQCPQMPVLGEPAGPEAASVVKRSLCRAVFVKICARCGGSCCGRPRCGTALGTIGLVQGLALGCKNEALLLLSVSTRTMIFATSVLAVMLVARVLGLEVLKKGKLAAAMLLASGGVLQGMASWQNQQQQHGQHKVAHEDQPLGFALAISALLLDALRWVLLQAYFMKETAVNNWPGHNNVVRQRAQIPTIGPRVVSNRLLPLAVPLDEAEPEMTSRLRVLFAGNSSMPASGGQKTRASCKLRTVSGVMWTTIPICLALVLAFEPTGLLRALRHPVEASGVVLLLTLGVTGINLAEFGVVQWTSAVTFNVLAQLHSIPLILGGVLCFGEQVSWQQAGGFALCLLGALVYSMAKAWEEPLLSPPELASGAGAIEVAGA